MGKYKFLEYEERPAERFGILRVNLPVLQPLLPRSVRTHIRAAVKEGLLAGRNLIDEAIKCMEAKEAVKPSS